MIGVPLTLMSAASALATLALARLAERRALPEASADMVDAGLLDGTRPD